MGDVYESLQFLNARKNIDEGLDMIKQIGQKWDL